MKNGKNRSGGTKEYLTPEVSVLLVKLEANFAASNWNDGSIPNDDQEDLGNY